MDQTAGKPVHVCSCMGCGKASADCTAPSMAIWDILFRTWIRHCSAVVQAQNVLATLAGQETHRQGLGGDAQCLELHPPNVGELPKGVHRLMLQLHAP